MKNKIKKEDFSTDSEIINIKVQNKEQIISNYSYDENDKINKDLSEFIVTKSKRVHISRDIKLNFYSNEHIEKTEIQSAIKNHFYEEYLESKSELKRLNIFIMQLRRYIKSIALRRIIFEKKMDLVDIQQPYLIKLQHQYYLIRYHHL